MHQVASTSTTSVRVFHAFNTKEKQIVTDIKDTRMALEAYKVDAEGNRIGSVTKTFSDQK